MKYPKVIRDSVDFTSDTEICNIGFYEGELNGERPIRCESWFYHGVLMLTCFISKLDLEKDKVVDMLVDNNIIEIVNNNIYIDDYTDSEDNTFYAVNVPLEKNDEIENKCLVKLDDYR